MQVGISLETAALTVLATVVGLTAIVALVRVRGLRSFAKMAPHDFAATLAVGSILGATASGSVPLAQGLVALVALFAFEAAIGRWRARGGESVTDNDPVLLMVGGEVRWEAMRRVGVTASDLRSKLREANACTIDQVMAVVFEGTGDISVLHGDPQTAHLDVGLLDGVMGLPDEPDMPATWRGGGRLGP